MENNDSPRCNQPGLFLSSWAFLFVSVMLGRHWLFTLPDIILSICLFGQLAVFRFAIKCSRI